MIGKLVRFGGLGILAAAFFGCAAVKDYVKEPEVDLRDVRVTAMSLADATLAFDLDIRNPNPLGLSMKGLTYQLDLEDETFFSGNHDERLRIGANDSSRLTLPFTFGYADVVDSLSALRGNEQINYRISGKAKFGPFTVPYEHTGTLPVPTVPEVSLQSLKVERLTFSGAELALGIRVKNANRFPIRFNSLDYQLELGGSSVLNGRTSKPFAVEPDQAGILRLPLTLDYGQVAGLAQKLRQGSSLPVAFKGSAKVPGAKEDITLPYEWNGDVPLFR